MKVSPARGARYARISEDQAGDGHGIANQLADEAAYAQRRGITITATYSDNDISATYGKPRPGYRAMMEAAARGEFDVILVFHTSRLWRNRKERAEGIEILRKAGISVEATKGPSLDMSTAYGRGMAALLGEFDTMETEIKSERQVLAAQARAKAGRPPLGTRLMGYTVTGRIIDAEAAHVREIFARFHAGDSLKGVAAWWLETGFPTRHGGKPNASTVRDILTNPRYCGRVYYNRHKNGISGEWASSADPAIIDEATWDAVNARLADPRRRKQQGTDRKHLGAGVYFCPNGHPVRSHGTPLRYRCEQGCVTRTAAQVDLAVTTLIHARLAQADVAQLVNVPTGKKASTASAEIRKLRGRLTQTEQDYDADLIDAHRYKEKTGKIRAEIEAAEKQLARLTVGSEVAGTLTAPDPVEAFDAAPLGVQQAVVRFFMEVRLLPAPRGRKGFDPETIRITPKHPVTPHLHAASPAETTAS